MKWAQALEGPPTCRLQGDVFGDNLVDSGAFTNEGNILVSDSARHVCSLRPVRLGPSIQG